MNEFDVEIFVKGPIILGLNMDDAAHFTKTLNTSFDGWRKVIVPVGSEMIDELTGIIHYERRYRLYLDDVYEMLGMEPTNHTNGIYWEKNENGESTAFYWKEL